MNSAFRRSLGFLAVLEIGSLLGHFYPSFALPILLAVTMGVFVLSLRGTAYGLGAIALELMIGSHGHMIGLGLKGEGGLSLRITMFVAVMIAWVINVLRRREALVLPPARVALLILALVHATLVALWLDVKLPALLSDANGYAFLALLLPVLSWARTADWEKAKMVVGIALAWLALKTLVLVYIFSHLSEPVLRAMYVWIRDTRVGEITRFMPPVYRIFIASQVFLALGLVYAAASAIGKQVTRRWYVYWGLIMSALLASLSRSFALALVVAVFCAAVIALVKRIASFADIGRLALRGFGVLVVGLALFAIVAKFPIPHQNAEVDLGALFRSRYGSASDPAASARWALLGPLWSEIKNAPMIGYGFGKEVSYFSPDPFWTDIRPDGLVTTTRFEWGWLDVWLKFGLIGGLFFVTYLVLLARRLSGAMLAVFIALLATHATTPFLDHPIGLGVLIALEAYALFGQVSRVAVQEGGAVHG